jgi:hypothetical protein
MKTWLLALSLLLPQIAHAGSSAAVIAVGYAPYAPAVRLQMQADYIAIPLTIQNDSKDPIKRTDEIERALRLITEKVKQQPDLKVKPGVVSLSPQEKTGLSKFSSYDSHGGSSGQLYILGTLKQEGTVFDLTKRVYQVVNAIQFSDGTKISLGNTLLGLDDPEKYRSQLLGLIAKSIDGTKKALNVNGSIELDGLESAVAVMQLNEREVIVFLNYRLQVQTKP